MYQNSFSYYPLTNKPPSVMSARSWNFEVLPPREVQKGKTLYPPLVVSVESPPEEFISVSVIAVEASDPNWINVMDPQWANTFGGRSYLSGQMVVNAHSLENGDGRKYAVFPYLEFTVAGTYGLIVTLSDDTSGFPMTIDWSPLMEGGRGRTTTVSVSKRHKERGSAHEEAVLDVLRQFDDEVGATFEVPKAPKKRS
ncbi:hypothetical protein SCUP234_05913 [Seiridium cupressi]|uniref:Uncharacterized protein n=1 Tax=Seiridium unicorne TaxID=138068 RepID=A0ABR2V7Z3_9PEZI